MPETPLVDEKIDRDALDEAADAVLAGAGADSDGDTAIPGLEADTKVTVLGTQFATSEDLVLGERIEMRVVGYVNFAGDQLLENEGKRRIVKVQSNLIEIVEHGD